MGDLLIRNVTEALKADLDKLADETGQSLSEAAKIALRDGVDLARKRLRARDRELPLGQRLKAIFAGTSEEELDEFHRYLEEQRNGSIGRPLPDFK